MTLVSPLNIFDSIDHERHFSFFTDESVCYLIDLMNSKDAFETIFHKPQDAFPEHLIQIITLMALKLYTKLLFS